MAIDEAARHRLHTKLEEAIGSEEAATLMGHLPPAGWADLATRRDLEATRRDLETKMDSLGDQLRAEMERLARRLIMWTSSAVIAAVGLAFAAGRLG